jgi:hypothetical protein
MSYKAEYSVDGLVWKPLTTGSRWILEHNREIDAFQVLPPTDVVLVPSYVRLPSPEEYPRPGAACWLVAYADETCKVPIFAEKWQDYTILHDWLDRPRLRGIPVYWFGHCTSVRKGW